MGPKIRFFATCASAVLVVGAFAGAAATARAADATASSQTAATNLGEVLVVARKRTENLQHVPVAVTSLSGTQLTHQGIRETADLQKVVPSLSIVGGAGSEANAATFSLRGQTAGDLLLTLSQPVGIYEDSVNVPHPDGLNGAMFDLDHVEVLKGPQGTLYGRNTTGGAVNIITRGADYRGLHGFVSGEYGNYNNWKIDGAVNVPLIQDKLAARIAYQHWNRRGVGTDIVTGQHPGFDHNDDLVRLSVRFDPTSSFTSSTKFEFANMDDVGYLQHVVALSPHSNAPLEAGLETHCGSLANPVGLFTCGLAALSPYVGGDPFQNGDEQHLMAKVRTWHFAEDWTWSLPYDMKLRSITGFHAVTDYPTLDDGTPFQIIEVFAGANGDQPLVNGPYTHPLVPEDSYHAVTQEVNLSGHALGRIDWLVGGFGSWEHGRGGEPFIAYGLLTQGLVSTTSISNGEDTKTWALYTQEDIHLLHNLSLTLGGRYTHEQQFDASQQYFWTTGRYFCNFTSLTNPLSPAAPGNDPSTCFTISNSERSNGLSYLLSLNYQITPDILAYAKTSRGFRGGALQFRAPAFPSVKPEVAVDYEIGFKGDFIDHRLRTNLAYYHTNYTNKQESVLTSVCGFQLATPGTLTCPGSVLTPSSTTILQNAASAKIDGFEAEATALPMAGWSVFGTLTYLNGRYASFPAAVNPDGATVNGSGAKLSDPSWRYSIGSRYEHEVGPGVLGASINWSWRAHNNLTVINTTSQFSLALQQRLTASVGLMDARIDYTFPEQGVTIALWATNLLNKIYEREFLLSSTLGIGTASTQAPRFFGVTITKTFGPG
ncbi:MAG: TonB-dependent receptor [Caulobacteraceae bacterium]|nr:TonB-dependent receptor [Caulobacteraceae bacterium]